MVEDGPRGTPVTLEEMTRRRDGWRQRYEGALGAIRSLKTQRDEQALRSTRFEDLASRVAGRVRLLERDLAASQAEARRFAEECGRLRDELAEARERRDDDED